MFKSRGSSIGRAVLFGGSSPLLATKFKIMEEKLVSFETAKLANEKGFDEVCSWLYYDPPKIIGKHHRTGQEYSLRLHHCGARQYNFYSSPPKDKLNRYHVCTQSLLQKWLREVYNIDVIINTYRSQENKWYKFFISQMSKVTIKSDDYNTYEEALEQGLREALRLIPQS